MQAVQSPVIPIIGELVRQTPGAISLGQGMVYYGPPPASLLAAQNAANDPAIHHYGPVTGSPVLLDQIRAKLALDNKIIIRDKSDACVTAGGNLAFHHALLAIADPGDEIILLRPYYFNHEMAVRMANCEPVLVDVDSHYQPDIEMIAAAITTNTRAIVTVSPNNPTGAVYSKELLIAVNQLCAERGIYHIHDEAYEYFVYGKTESFSPASQPGVEDHTISLFSLSKSYGFAGWRIGYMVVPIGLMSAIRKIQDTTLICPSTLSQRAAIAAMREGADYCKERINLLNHTRQQFIQKLSTTLSSEHIGPAQGAFYLFLTLPTSESPMEIATRLVREYKVAVIPGDAFGITDKCTLRVSYGAIGGDDALEGLERLSAGLVGILG